eukprot:TRINITY_DN1266_c0_g1_i1.p1 TRINITY_DN1266_c0_g1~~TRINITY_DN1266_c0_g1_i1.p1  ORF type:complete len:248 (+),score=81.77 TRINITY_DN1266_c0_g1_i1:132-875(+)
MAPGADDERKQALKEKLAQATSKAGSKKEKKPTKAQAKDKAQANEKAKADAKAKEDAAKAEAARLRAAATPQRAPEAAPSPFALPGEEAKEIGIHLGISCDGCGRPPPLVGRAMKCRDCPDFDLCEECYPGRLDLQREKVAVGAGLPPGSGKHPGKHVFGARRAAVVLSREDADKENKLSKEASSRKDSKEPVFASASGAADPRQRALSEDHLAAAPYSPWRPIDSLAEECPTALGPPQVLGKQWLR